MIVACSFLQPQATAGLSRGDNGFGRQTVGTLKPPDILKSIDLARRSHDRDGAAVDAETTNGKVINRAVEENRTRSAAAWGYVVWWCLVQFHTAGRSHRIRLCRRDTGSTGRDHQRQSHRKHRGYDEA